jgi:NagD protein
MFFIDVQGTIIDDLEKKPIAGAIEFIDYLNSNNIDYMIVTNNTKDASEDFLAYLQSIGFNIPKEKYLDPIMLIENIVTSKKVAAFGHEKFLKVLQDKGYELEYKNPDTVVVGVSHEYNMDDFATMNECLLNGAELIGMHLTTLYAKNGRRYPGVGAILEMLRLSTGKEPTVVGKPSQSFYQKAFSMSDAYAYEEITMISDDVKGDLLGAKALGMETIFVLSGKYKSADEVIPSIDEELRPLYTLDSIKDVFDMVKEGKIEL